MTASSTDPPVRDLLIRELTPADAAAGAALARSRGWSHEPGRWAFQLAVGRGWGAVDATGDLVGTVQLTACTPDVVAVGSMLVAAPLEGRGLGRALLDLALDAAGDRLVTLVATRQGRPLYERSGFRPVGELVMHRGAFTDRGSGPSGGAGPAGGPDVAGALGPARSRAGDVHDLAAIAALDTCAHGGDRSRLLSALLGFARAVRVADDGTPGGVRAFGAAWPSDGRVIVGPLVAADDDAATAVLDGLAADLPGPARVDVRSGRPGIAAWLAGRGFEPFARAVVMVRGPHDLPGRAELIHAPIMQSLT